MITMRNILYKLLHKIKLVRKIQNISNFFWNNIYFSYPENIEKKACLYKKILLIAPHPDDETFWMWWFLYTFRDKIDIVRITNKKNKMRYNEAKNLLSYLDKNNEEPMFIFDDENINTKYLCMQLKNMCIKKQYDVICVPSIFDCHHDHLQITKIIKDVFWGNYNLIQCDVLQYEVWNTLVPTHYLNITENIEHKKKMMNIFFSQLKTVNYIDWVLSLNKYRWFQNSINWYCEWYILTTMKEFISLYQK